MTASNRAVSLVRWLVFAVLPAIVMFRVMWLLLALRDESAFRGFGLGEWVLWVADARGAAIVTIFVLVCWMASYGFLLRLSRWRRVAWAALLGCYLAFVVEMDAIGRIEVVIDGRRLQQHAAVYYVVAVLVLAAVAFSFPIGLAWALSRRPRMPSH